MLLLAIMILSIVIQFCAAGMALLLIRTSHRNCAWIVLASALFLMGVRRTVSLVTILISGIVTLDPVAEGVALLISILMLAGVWMIRDVFDGLNRLRVNAEDQVEKRKKVEADLTVSLGQAEEAKDRLRESEEKLRFLGDNLPGMLLYQIDCGVDGLERRFTYISRGVEQIHEMSVAEVKESPFAICTQMCEQDRRSFVEFERAAMGSMSLFSADFRIDLRSGITKWIQIASAPRRTSNNHLLWDGFEIDITERKRLEEALQRNSETLGKAVAERTTSLQRLAAELTLAEQRERRRLSDFLHDDLQQVLVGAKFVAQRLVSDHPADVLTDEVCKLRDLMTEALNKTRSLCNELVTPLLYVVGLVPALRQLAGQMQEHYGFNVIFEIQDMAVQQEALKVQLFHAVRELLFNAVKHSGTDTALLRGWISDGRIELMVKDSGKGFNAGGVSHGTAEECGCGLFSIRERIEALGGTLTVDSAPGAGTRVTISVPVPPEQGPAPQKERPPSSDARSPAGTKGPARVLVVDDHVVVRRGVMALLGHEPTLTVVGEAANGREAVDLARQLCPDVVVMDIQMPEMNGIEATRLIKAEFPDAIVIGLSAFADKEFRTEMLNAGAVDLLDKGNAGKRLPVRIAECLDQRLKGQGTATRTSPAA